MTLLVDVLSAVRFLAGSEEEKLAEQHHPMTWNEIRGVSQTCSIAFRVTVLLDFTSNIPLHSE
jgi:hypothetical protein